MSPPDHNRNDRGAPRISAWRAIPIGLVFGLGGLYFGMYGYLIVQVLHWSTTSLQLGSVLVLFFIVTLNALVGRVVPRLRLRPAELLVVFTIATIATSIGAHGMMGYIIPMLPGARYYATPENNWDALFRYLPQWLIVTDDRAIKGFYEATGTLYSLETVRAWVGPLAFWLPFLALMVFGEWALCNLVSQQWIERERLTFPLAQLPLAMAGAGPNRDFWRNRAMWIGFAIPMVLQSMNFLHFLYPPIPGVWMKARPVAASLTGMPWAAMRPLYIAFYPFVIGVVFLLSLETSLSCWFFFWMSKAENVACAMMGLGGGSEGVNQLPLIAQQGTGALLTLAILSLLLTVRSMRRSARSREPEGVQVLSNRTGLTLLAVCFVGLVGMSSAAGLPILVGVCYYVLRWLIELAWARVAAETGSGWTFNTGATIQQTLIAFAGTRPIGSAGLPMFSTLDTFEDYSDSRGVQLLASFKYREIGEIPRKLLRNAVVVGVPASVVYAAWVHLDIYYRHGAAMAIVRPWYPSRGAEPWRLLESWSLRPRSPDWWQVGGYAWGAIVVLLLRGARFGIPSWPFHPIGYAVAHTDSMDYMWMPFLIAWLVKSVVLRYGGIKLYQRLVPVFMGLIMGDVVVAGLWGIYGVATGQRLYMHFPH